MLKQVVLAPVPWVHLESAEGVPKLRERVAFGSSSLGLPAFPIGLPVCLPETRSDNTDDEVRQGSAEQQAGRAGGSADGPANLCPRTDEFGIRCNSRGSLQGSGENGPHRNRGYERVTRGGPKRHTAQHARSRSAA